MPNWIIFMVGLYVIFVVAGVVDYVCGKGARYIYCKIGASYLKEQKSKELYTQKHSV